MHPFRKASIRAALRADYGDQLAHEDWIIVEEDERRRAGHLLIGLSRLFGPVGALRGGRDAPDALGLQPLLPPL